MIEPYGRRSRPGNGIQRLYRFANGYGASVVCSDFSYGGSEGLFELAVLRFDRPDSDTFELTYSTPITEDVIGHLYEDGVQDLLLQIEALPAEPSTADLGSPISDTEAPESEHNDDED